MGENENLQDASKSSSTTLTWSISRKIPGHIGEQYTLILNLRLIEDSFLLNSISS